MKRSIFYLDDEPICVQVFGEMFGNEYDVQTATTLTEAREKLAARPSDIIISDQRMPEIEGTAFLREVAAMYPSSFRMMLTGGTLMGDVIREISDGTVNLFLAKPWMEEEMRQALERASASFELRNKARQVANDDDAKPGGLS